MRSARGAVLQCSNTLRLISTIRMHRTKNLQMSEKMFMNVALMLNIYTHHKGVVSITATHTRERYSQHSEATTQN